MKKIGLAMAGVCILMLTAVLSVVGRGCRMGCYGARQAERIVEKTLARNHRVGAAY